MRVVGKSGVVMDLPDHVATGLLSSGVVTEVPSEITAVIEVPAVVIPPIPPLVTGGGIGTDPDSANSREGSDSGPKLPPGNGSREVWAEFALTHGKTEDDLQGLTQTQIRDLFKTETE